MPPPRDLPGRRDSGHARSQNGGLIRARSARAQSPTRRVHLHQDSDTVTDPVGDPGRLHSCGVVTRTTPRDRLAGPWVG